MVSSEVSCQLSSDVVLGFWIMVIEKRLGGLASNRENSSKFSREPQGIC